MSNRQQIIEQLGSMMEQASRSSVARGAGYQPGESISLDSEAAWRGVAETLVAMAEVLVKNGDLEKAHVDPA